MWTGDSIPSTLKTFAIGCETPMTVQTGIEEARGLNERHCAQHCVEDLTDAHDANLCRDPNGDGSTDQQIVRGKSRAMPPRRKKLRGRTIARQNNRANDITRERANADDTMPGIMTQKESPVEKTVF